MLRAQVAFLLVISLVPPLCAQDTLQQQVGILDEAHKQWGASLGRWRSARENYAKYTPFRFVCWGAVGAVAIVNAVIMLAHKERYKRLLFERDARGHSFWKRIFRDKPTTLAALQALFSVGGIVAVLKELYSCDRAAAACRAAEQEVNHYEKKYDDTFAAFKLTSAAVAAEGRSAAETIETLETQLENLRAQYSATQQTVNTPNRDIDAFRLNSRALEIALRRWQLCDTLICGILRAFEKDEVAAENTADLFLTLRKLCVLHKKYNLSLEILLRGREIWKTSRQVDSAYEELFCTTDADRTQKLGWVATLLGAQERALRDAQAVAYDRLLRQEKELAILSKDPSIPY